MEIRTALGGMWTWNHQCFEVLETGKLKSLQKIRGGERLCDWEGSCERPGPGRAQFPAMLTEINWNCSVKQGEGFRGSPVEALASRPALIQHVPESRM